MVERLPLTPILLAFAITLTASACGSELSSSVRSDIDGQMKSKQPRMARCYERALEREADTRGRIVLAFEVDERTGRFREVRVLKSTVRDQSLENCIVGQARGLRLQKKSDQKVLVTYHLRFRPRVLDADE